LFFCLQLAPLLIEATSNNYSLTPEPSLYSTITVTR
jgi:hypothetical protein